MATTIKHFPGLGEATENTDDVSVTIDTPRAGLALGPFEAGIEAGAPLVMVSHALYPALDDEAIASQSRPVVEDLLRDELGFEGAVVTDSIEAQAVLDRSGVAEAAERSVEAGVDLVLMTGSGSWNEVYPRLLRRARRDPAFRERVAESLERVLALKRRLGLDGALGLGRGPLAGPLHQLLVHAAVAARAALPRAVGLHVPREGVVGQAALERVLDLRPQARVLHRHRAAPRGCRGCGA